MPTPIGENRARKQASTSTSACAPPSSGLLRLGMRYLTGGSDIAYIVTAGRADVKQLRELKLD